MSALHDVSRALRRTRSINASIESYTMMHDCGLTIGEVSRSWTNSMMGVDHIAWVA